MKTKKINIKNKKNIKNIKTNKKNKKINKSKYIIFDMDETLGSFQKLYILFYYINSYRNSLNKLNLNFYEKSFILDKFPYFFRINIWSILEKINNLKNKKSINCVIYTNNTGGYLWPLFITNYINYKLNNNLIKQLVPIYKINDEIVEPLRTTNNKTYDDICRCLNIQTTTKICFIDDNEHSDMYNPNVNYVKVEPYKYFPKIKDLLYELENEKNIDDIIPNYPNFLKYIGNDILENNSQDESNINLINEIAITENIKKKITKYIYKK